MALFPTHLSRRSLLAVTGASALAAHGGLLDFASSLFADVPKPAFKPRVRVVFVRPEADRNWMGWPGAAFNPEAKQAEYTRILTEAAKKLGVQFEVSPIPVHEPESVEALVEDLPKLRLDGLVAIVMNLKSWPQALHIAKNRGDAPMIVFSPLGTSMAEQIKPILAVPKTFVAATQDVQWLATGMRMLKAVAEMKQARICMIAGDAIKDRRIDVLGTTLHYVPLERWVAEVRKTEDSDESRALADYYAREAVRVVEPRKADLLEAAKNYVVARRIMAAEKCQGISVDCYRLLNERRIGCGMCVAWSRLLDEGIVAACEADADAAVTMLMTGLLFDRPGFQQDPSPNTVSGTLIGNHCTCATRLAGFTQPHEPFELRNHAESETGVAMKVTWRPEQEITVVKFQPPNTLALCTGRVVGNVAEKDATGCRTSIEVRLDGVDPKAVQGNHQLFVYGKLDAPLSAFASLAGLQVAGICEGRPVQPDKPIRHGLPPVAG